MRSIATFKEEKLALRFWNYLQGEEIESALEEDGNDAWAIWVIDEEKIPAAIQFSEKFKLNPDENKFELNFFGKKNKEMKRLTDLIE